MKNKALENPRNRAKLHANSCTKTRKIKQADKPSKGRIQLV
nr:MAG TPA: hypothetical protein [Caudoviricetes sp.]